MNESGTWRSIKPVLVEANLDPHRIENIVGDGTPDVNYLNGWIELKHKREWPKRESTLVRLPHFTAMQRRWLERRHNLGGKCFLLLRVELDWLLFDGLTAAWYVGRMSKNDLIRVCLVCTKKKRDLLQWL